MRIAVIGARGQLGASIVHEARKLDHDVVPFDRTLLDIEDDAAVREAMGRTRPDAIINCAGYNNVDAAESHPVAALRANAFAVRSLAHAARDTGATLVQYSSDFVFDGRASAPMSEELPPNPLSAYAASKLLGEWFAAEAPAAYVLRVESLFGAAPGSTPKGSVAAIVNGLRAGHVVRVFRDRTVSPTYVEDASTATLSLLERQSPTGLYHCVNSGSATWLEVAQEAARQLGVTPQFESISVADVTLPAGRPQYCALSNAKLGAAIGRDLPAWQHALARYLGVPFDR
ncbi:MAG TPA: dTDP-4-dehydrorhamnose reductase [Vicinamibacterales bacterium]|nr:dTDP-4-dehydrorhamnose reductase [Vicinamibacterales bacterium]